MVTGSNMSNSDHLENKKRVRRGESFCRTGVDRTISNSLKSPSKQKQKMQQRKVTFTEQTPLLWECSNFEPNMTAEEYEERKHDLWYSKYAFEDFLKERISTIQLLKLVHGDANAMREKCPDLCMRGLEPYEANSLNQELQSARQLHQRIVLAEQTIQKRSGVRDPERIRLLAEERSAWARQRAQQLANMDELDLKENVQPAASRRRSMAAAETGLQNLVLDQKRRSSLTFSPPLLSRRVPVDMAILKEWNAKFLADIRRKAGDAAASGLPMSLSTLSDATAQSRLALTRDNVLGSSHYDDANNEELSSSDAMSPPSSTTRVPTEDFRFTVRRDSLLGLRRDSLLQVNNNNMRNSGPALNDSCFRFPVRRDSLSNLYWH